MKHGTWNYTYDGNGNLKTDPSKGTTGITYGYNLLNLPQTVTGSKTISYTYDAAGQKLRRVSTTTTGGTGTTDYISGIEYDDPNNSGTETLSFIQTEEGKAVPNGSGGYNYNYYLGDNLGNTRVTFDTQTGVAAIVQADNYYPFGMEQSVSANGTKNEYLYNKKELQEELGVYDFGARGYDPVLGRWTTVDPLAEKNRRWTVYNFVKDNPINLIDPDGMDSYNLTDQQLQDFYGSGVSVQHFEEQQTDSKNLPTFLPQTTKKNAKDNVNQNQSENSSGANTSDDDKPFFGKTTTYVTNSPTVVKGQTDYYTYTYNAFTETVVGQEGSLATFNVNVVDNKTEGVDVSWGALGGSTEGELSNIFTMGNTTVTVSFGVNKITIMTTIKNTDNTITGGVMTAVPRYTHGYQAACREIINDITRGIYTIAPNSNQPIKFWPFPGDSHFPIPIPE